MKELDMSGVPGQACFATVTQRLAYIHAAITDECFVFYLIKAYLQCLVYRELRVYICTPTP